MAQGADRRKMPRVPTQGLTTPYGEVMNLSVGGLALFRKGSLGVHLGQRLTVRLEHEGSVIQLDGRVQRVRPMGLFRHEIGLRFVDLMPQTVHQLDELLKQLNDQVAPRLWIEAA
jgi:hypothetical protein